MMGKPMNNLTRNQQVVLDVIRRLYGDGRWFDADSLPHIEVKRTGYVCSILHEKNRLNRTYSKESQTWVYQLASS